MEYVIPVVLVVLVVAGFVTYLVLNATEKSGPAAEGGSPGIGRDPTPVGDTTQHAGRQTESGTTTGGQDAVDAGGTGRPATSGAAGTSSAGASADDPDAAAHVARPGEGEGREEVEFEGERPQAAGTRSERLADRDR
jgi:hypothetical protein